MQYRSSIVLFFSSLLFLYSFATPAHAEVKAAYLYNLSDSEGVIPYNWVNLSADKKNNEVYAVNISDGSVRIFNDAGMEVYSFGIEDVPGNIYDVAVEENGDLVLLSYINGKYSIIRCNFRGEPKSSVELKDLPPGFSTGFYPIALRYQDGRIYLADKGAMKVLVTDKDGRYENSYDLASIMGLDEKKRSETGIVGFSVDRAGNLLFTVPSLFTAYVVSPDRKVKTFGVRGSAPGKFNIVGGIAEDDNGNYYVVDTLRSVVMVFDKEFKFQTEFGGWGFDPGDLIAPMEVRVVNSRVYVTQTRKRGISVFRVLSD